MKDGEVRVNVNLHFQFPDLLALEEKAATRFLFKASGYIQRAAQRQIHSVPYKGKHLPEGVKESKKKDLGDKAPPGHSPYDHGRFKRSFKYAIDLQNRTGIVGPIGFMKNGRVTINSRTQTIGELHEFGGYGRVDSYGDEVVGKFPARPTMKPVIERANVQKFILNLWENAIKK